MTVTATAEVGEVTIVLEGQEALQVLIATGTGDGKCLFYLVWVKKEVGRD